MSCRHKLVSLGDKLDLYKDCETKTWRLFLMNKEHWGACVDLSWSDLCEFQRELVEVIKAGKEDVG